MTFSLSLLAHVSEPLSRDLALLKNEEQESQKLIKNVTIFLSKKKKTSLKINLFRRFEIMDGEFWKFIVGIRVL